MPPIPPEMTIQNTEHRFREVSKELQFDLDVNAATRSVSTGSALGESCGSFLALIASVCIMQVLLGETTGSPSFLDKR